jgi:D-alanine-D-alanine ligase-like ATP-grasp enzyme
MRVEANEAVRNPRMLVVSRKEKHSIGHAGFDQVVDSLNRGGLSTEHVPVSSLRDFEGFIARRRPDIALCNFFKFPGHDDGQGYLRDSLVRDGVAWIGSTSDTMELARSKPRMKLHWRLNGIVTPEWFTVRKFSDGSIEGFELMEGSRDFPYIVKPANGGELIGIDSGSVVRTPSELSGRAKLIVDEYGEALVERYLDSGAGSRRFTAVMIGNGTNAIVSAIEIENAGNPGISNTKPIEAERLKARVEHIASKIFITSGVRDYAQCDIMLHEDKLYAIGMNAQPTLPSRLFHACARENGLDEMQYIEAIALAGIIGNAQTGHAFIAVPREMAKILPTPVFERLTKRSGSDAKPSGYRR